MDWAGRISNKFGRKAFSEFGTLLSPSVKRKQGGCELPPLDGLSTRDSGKSVEKSNKNDKGAGGENI